MACESIVEQIIRYGGAILQSEGMQSEKKYIQHGGVSCYLHSVSVAYVSVRLAECLHIRCDRSSLIRGALLHDYFLYDWHIPGSTDTLHAFSHARAALKNASRDFDLNPIERDIIRKHMFPLNLALPRYRESVLVTLADKICAFWEICARSCAGAAHFPAIEREMFRVRRQLRSGLL